MASVAAVLQCRQEARRIFAECSKSPFVVVTNKLLAMFYIPFALALCVRARWLNSVHNCRTMSVLQQVTPVMSGSALYFKS